MVLPNSLVHMIPRSRGIGIARLWLEAEDPLLPVVLYKLSYSAALIISPLLRLAFHHNVVW